MPGAILQWSKPWDVLLVAVNFLVSSLGINTCGGMKKYDWARGVELQCGCNEYLSQRNRVFFCEHGPLELNHSGVRVLGLFNSLGMSVFGWGMSLGRWQDLKWSGCLQLVTGPWEGLIWKLKAVNTLSGWDKGYSGGRVGHIGHSMISTTEIFWSLWIFEIPFWCHSIILSVTIDLQSLFCQCLKWNTTTHSEVTLFFFFFALPESNYWI